MTIMTIMTFMLIETLNLFTICLTIMYQSGSDDAWIILILVGSPPHGSEGSPGVAAAGVTGDPLGAERRPTLWCLWW